MFKQSKWLWKSASYQTNSYAMFFKHVDVTSKVDHAVIHISAHNHFKLYINQVLVSGLVVPAPSQIYEQKLYCSYDVAPYLKIGKNIIEVVVLYLGGGGQNYIDGMPGFILEGAIVTNNRTLTVVSDFSWQYYQDIPYKDGMPFQQSRRISPVEYFDGSIQPKPLKCGQVIELPGYKNYELQRIPEGQRYEIIVPKLYYQSDIVRVYDVERIISGFYAIEIKTSSNATFTIRYSEDLEDNRVKYNVANEYSSDYKDMLHIPKDSYIKHAADFTYKAFRYIELEGPIEAIVEVKFLVHAASTKIDIVGKLSSKDHPYISRLFDMFYHTQKNNTLNLLVDCPHREQAQYLGDSALQAESLIYNVKQADIILEKVLDDFKYSQYPDGTFPFVAPGSTNLDQFSLKIPEYDLYFIELIYKRYQIDLNVHIKDKYYHEAVKLIDHYIRKIDTLGLVCKTSDWHISDWPYPTVDHGGNYLTYDNMLFYRMLGYFIELYPKHANIAEYQTLHKQLKENIQKYLKSNGRYKDHETSTSYHQGIQAFGILCGLFDSEEVESVLDYIKSCGISTSIILSKYVIEALMMHDQMEAALTFIFDYDRGWGHIIRQQSPTMWEGFDDIESHSHAWGMYVIRYLQQYLMGIAFVKGKTNQVIIAPKLSDKVKDLSASVQTLQGVLTIAYEIIGDALHLRYDVPTGIVVTFIYKQTKHHLTTKGFLEIII